MRKGSLFWGGILILFGGLLLLNNLGIINVNVWGLFWPSLLIALGLWTLWGFAFGRRTAETEKAAVPLEGAGQAHVQINHGAGRLYADDSAGPDELAAGTFGGGLNYRTRRAGDTLDVEMRARETFVFPWNWTPGSAHNWKFGLNSEIPLSLEFKTGANEARLDLASLHVTDLRVETGASSTEITLPANAGHTRARIRAGAASVEVRVPDGVAASIRVKGGLSGTSVDTHRFPRMGDIYQSVDYDAALNKVELDVEIGVGSVDVR